MLEKQGDGRRRVKLCWRRARSHGMDAPQLTYGNWASGNFTGENFMNTHAGEMFLNPNQSGQFAMQENGTLKANSLYRQVRKQSCDRAYVVLQLSHARRRILPAGRISRRSLGAKPRNNFEFACGVPCHRVYLLYYFFITVSPILTPSMRLPLRK